MSLYDIFEANYVALAEYPANRYIAVMDMFG
jgi:hypothetical protein